MSERDRRPVTIGIDVGGTNLKAGLVSPEGRLLSVCRQSVGVFEGPEELCASLSSLARRTAAERGVPMEQVASVGIGLPGAVEGGEVLYTCNLPMKHVPLAALFRRQLDLPVRLGNDADCAAVGEYLCGAGRGTQNFLTVTLGTGVGAGLILNGRLYTGMGMAGEAGHMALHPEGLPCSCGRRGCWEQYASGTALIRMTREAMALHPESLLHAAAAEAGAVDGRTAFAAARQGDGTALAVCGAYASAVAEGLIDLANLLHPERIALGGGIADAPEELLLSPVREQAARSCYARHGGRVTEIVRARLGNDAGILGAALLDRALI